MTLYAMEYAATAVTPSRATIATRTSAPPCRTVKSADIGSPVVRVRRSAAPVASEGGEPADSRSSALRRRARSPAARATHAAQHGRDGGALDAVRLDEQRVESEDQAVGEEGQAHRGAGVAGALRGCRRRGSGRRRRRCPAGRSRSTRRRGTGRVRRRRGRAGPAAPAAGIRRRTTTGVTTAHSAQPPRTAARSRARVPGPSGVRDQHGRTGGEDQGDAEQHVLGVGRDGDGGHRRRRRAGRPRRC